MKKEFTETRGFACVSLESQITQSFSRERKFSTGFGISKAHVKEGGKENTLWKKFVSSVKNSRFSHQSQSLGIATAGTLYSFKHIQHNVNEDETTYVQVELIA